MISIKQLRNFEAVLDVANYLTANVHKSIKFDYDSEKYVSLVDASFNTDWINGAFTIWLNFSNQVDTNPYAYLVKHHCWEESLDPEIMLASELQGNFCKENLVLCQPLYKGKCEIKSEEYYDGIEDSRKS